MNKGLPQIVLDPTQIEQVEIQPITVQYICVFTLVKSMAGTN